MNDNTKMEAIADNPRLVGKEEYIPTIDSLISAQNCDVLKNNTDAIIDIGMWGKEKLLKRQLIVVFLREISYLAYILHKKFCYSE